MAPDGNALGSAGTAQVTFPPRFGAPTAAAAGAVVGAGFAAGAVVGAAAGAVVGAGAVVAAGFAGA